jgi:hypothetical protein
LKRVSWLSPSGCRRRRLGLDEPFQIRLGAASEHRLPYLVAQPNERDQIAALQLDLAGAESKSLLKSGSSWSID